jgi:hypothetical protein
MELTSHVSTVVSWQLWDAALQTHTNTLWALVSHIRNAQEQISLQ